MERELFTALMRQAATIIEGQWRPSKASYTHLEVLAVVLWAAVHDRPISWACDRANWPCHEYRRRLPSGSTVRRRSRRPEMLDILTTLIASLRVRGEGERTLIVDGRPLTIAKHHNDPDAGFGRAAGGIGAGYKLHQIVDLLGNCRAFRVESLNASEPVVARAMLEELAEGEADVLLADAAYDCNKTYEAAGAKGCRCWPSVDIRTPRASAIGATAPGVWTRWRSWNASPSGCRHAERSSRASARRATAWAALARCPTTSAGCTACGCGWPPSWPSTRCTDGDGPRQRRRDAKCPLGAGEGVGSTSEAARTARACRPPARWRCR